MKRSEIEDRATQILRDHGLLMAPVDPLKVAKALDIKVMNAVFSETDKSGAIVKRGQNFAIYVNANEPPARKRFTIAHEIGHKLLHMTLNADAEFVDNDDNFRTNETIDVSSWTEERVREWEANTFASALLMNRELVLAKWQETNDINYLAWVFQVSQPAMSIRLTQLGLLKP
jgi:Zn-dependent peptidase ImmA (M78 family)